MSEQSRKQMSGYGRGGRGAAILQALEAQSRQPGEDVTATNAPTPGQIVASKPTLGRGALMQKLMAQHQQAQQKQQRPQPTVTSAEKVPLSTPSAASAPTGRGMGRGLLGLMARSSGGPPPPLQSTGLSSNTASVPAVSQAQPAPVSAQSSPVTTAHTLPSAASPGASTSVPACHMGRGLGALQSVKPTQPCGSSSPAKNLSSAAQAEATMSLFERRMERLSLQQPLHKDVGTAGQRVPLMANFIKLETKNQDGIYQYKVVFQPPLDSIMIRKRLVRTIEDLPKPFEFDGAVMFMPIRLPKDTFNGKASSREGVEYNITVALVRVVPYSSMTQFFNIMFNRIMSILKMCPIGRMYYDPHKPTILAQHKMEVWPGYVSSVKEYDGGLMCLLDTTHKVLRTETVYDVIYFASLVVNATSLEPWFASIASAVRFANSPIIAGADRDSLLVGIMTDVTSRNRNNYQDAIQKEIIGVSVLTRYNNKTYRIDDVDFHQAPSSTFETRNGPISYADYFWQHHNQKINDLNQPLLIHRPTEREKRESRGRPLDLVCLVPELCSMTGLTDKVRADFRVMKDLATHTRISPAQRQQRLRQFTENVNSHPEAREVLNSWGLKLADNSYSFTGRKLDPETIFFSGNTSTSAGDRADWSAAATKNTVREPIELNCWLVICTQRNQQDVAHFVQQVESCYRQLGISINKPIFRTIPNDRTETFLQEIRRNFCDQLQLVMTVFPTSRDDRYNAVKKLCYVEMPVASQVMLAKTIQRRERVRSVAQKVALQMNCKLGGGLWSVKIPLDGLMIVGVDVFHDTPHGKSSWGGFVSTLNRDCTQWYSRVCRQMPGQELGNALAICMLTALSEYTKRNGTPPRRIVILRDGVGEGDLNAVREHEVAQFVSTFAKFGESYQPKLTCITVQKRVNTKLYLHKGNMVDNAPPGTITDHGVTRRELVDFYLVSQFVRQGTVTPTHYVIVHDESGWKPDNLQKLAYKMCHMYYNWPGTIRSPAPCQYAHKLAYMVGQSLCKDPDQRLCTRLFFL